MAKRLGRVPIAESHMTIQGWELIAEVGTNRRNRIGFVRVIPSEQLEEVSVDETDLVRESD
jgi:hypothetical protein